MALPLLADARATCDWLAQRGVRALTTDSRRVQPGDAFIAWPGHALDGRQYVLFGGGSVLYAWTLTAGDLEAVAREEPARLANETRSAVG